MSEWMTCKVGEIAQIFDGPHATPKKTEHGPWFLSISSLEKGRLNLAESAHLSEQDYTHWTRRVTPEQGDLLFSYETRLGDAALMPQGVRACLGRRMGLLRPDKDKIDPRFLLYAYIAPDFQRTIEARKIHGATVERIPLNELASWPINLPVSLMEQQAIAAILGALDDKVLINERIATTYEELMTCEFEQLGLVPDDQSLGVVPITDLVEFNPRTIASRGSQAIYVDMAALSTTRAAIKSWIYRDPKSGTRFRSGDTLLARITPCLENGKTGYVDFIEPGQTGTGSTEFIVMRSKPKIPNHLSYFLARNARFREFAIRNMVGSSGRQRVGASSIAEFLVCDVGNQILVDFGNRARSVFDHMRSLENENRTLIELRDTLLPELMSGRMRVKDAEKAVEEVT